MWLRILTFRVEAKVLRQRVQKFTLACLHRFEPQALLLFVSRKDTEFSLLSLAELGVISEEFKRLC